MMNENAVNNKWFIKQFSVTACFFIWKLNIFIILNIFILDLPIFFLLFIY